jgi:tetratricopeptide (TPR) repeat protein
LLSIKRASFVTALLCLIVASRVVANEPSENKPAAKSSKRAKAAVTVSKETTYITEPLWKDGSVDYVAALDQLARQGVTPANNAAVLFWQAVGPGEIWEEIRDEYFRKLGIPTLPEKGDYFVNLENYLARQKEGNKSGNGKPEAGSQVDVYEIMDQVTERPWSRKEYPVIAQWLEANEKPLSLIVEASKRPRRYDPLIGSRLIVAPCMATMSCRDLARVIIVRAMLRLNDGKIDEAWEDLLTCHRLARLMGQGPTFIEALPAGSLEEWACAGDLALLQNTHLTAAQAARMREDLNKLPPMPVMKEKISVAERFTFLDDVSYSAQQGLPGFAGFTSIKPYKYLQRTVNLLVSEGKRSPVDWDVSLRMGNAWFDRIAEAFNKPTRNQQKESLKELQEEFNNLKKTVTDANSLEKSMLEDRRKAISQRVAEIFIVTFGPEICVSSAVSVEERYTMRFELDKIAFALAAYRADHGKYPVMLGDLVPKYIVEVPRDEWNDSELHYRHVADGFVLYSAGNNGRDDGAKSYEDRNHSEEPEELVKRGEDWDDLVVRIPAPRVEIKKAPRPKESSKEDSAADSKTLDLLEKKIQQSVKDLEYSDQTAQDAARLAMSWRDYGEDKSLLLVLNQKFTQAQQDFKKQKLTKIEMARIEEEIVEEFRGQFMFGITNESNHFSLDEVVKDQKANCLGYTQVFYILGNAIGLSVQPIWVEEMFDYNPTPGQLHAANLVSLADNKTLLVDFAFGYISEPFVFDEQYGKVGNYWELKHKWNVLQLHPKIQILDGKGLVGCINFSRGAKSLASGEYDQAIVDYSKVIQLIPQSAWAYANRGFAYDQSGRHKQAIADYSKAIELNLKFGAVYYLRGAMHARLGNLFCFNGYGTKPCRS